MAQPGHDASKVRASGPGLDTKGVPASLPVEFTIDARDAGEGLLTVQILVRADLTDPIIIDSNSKIKFSIFIITANIFIQESQADLNVQEYVALKVIFNVIRC